MSHARFFTAVLPLPLVFDINRRLSIFVTKQRFETMARQVNAATIALLHRFESCKLKAYECPKSLALPKHKKFWTIGWGNTYYEDGSPVKEGDVITQQRADKLFEFTLARFADDVDNLLKKRVTDNQFGALVSFAYNVGSDIDADTIPEGLGDSTLLKLVNANPNDPRIFQYKLATDGIAATGSCELLKWVNKGSNFEKGLRRRRQAECDLYRS
jgi:lysozyme